MDLAPQRSVREKCDPGGSRGRHDGREAAAEGGAAAAVDGCSGGGGGGGRTLDESKMYS